MREKYAKEIALLNRRYEFGANEEILDGLRKNSRAATLDMLQTVERWKSSREQWSPEEWDQVKMIESKLKQLNQAETARLHGER